MVLNPILKSSGSGKMNNSNSVSQVSFNSSEESNIIDYLKSEDGYKHSVKLNSFIKRITHPTTEVKYYFILFTFFFMWCKHFCFSVLNVFFSIFTINQV